MEKLRYPSTSPSEDVDEKKNIEKRMVFIGFPEIQKFPMKTISL